MSSWQGGQSPYRMTLLQERTYAMSLAMQVDAALDAYSPGGDWTLALLRLIYQRYQEGIRKLKEGDTYHLYQMYSTYDQDPYIDFGDDYYIRDDAGFIMIEPSISYGKEILDQNYLSSIQGQFVRTLKRTELIKEELMSKTK